MSEWTWTNGAPPGPQTARAGELWTLELPLQGTGEPPAVEWTEVPDGLEIRPSPRGPLVFDFIIPVSLGGSTHELKYRRGDNQLTDLLWLKILPASPSASEEDPIIPQPSTPAPEPPSAEVTPEPGEPDVEGIGGQRDASPGGEAPVNGGRAAPDPLAEYEVQVYRGATALMQLTRPLRLEKSLLVGKLARLAHGVSLPDINLRGHFAGDQAEVLCSRQQAKIFWSQGLIYLLNTGENPIVLPDGRGLKTGEDYAWQPGEEVTLPGGLILRLALVTC